MYQSKVVSNQDRAVLTRLLCNKFLRTDAQLNEFDGLSAAAVGTEWVITSPNCRYIPQPASLPFNSTRYVHLRRGGRFGFDEPSRWPQEFTSRDSPWIHHICIERKPKDPEDKRLILWWTPKREDFLEHAAGNGSGLGKIAWEHRKKLVGEVDVLRKLYEEEKKEGVIYGRTRNNIEWVADMASRLNMATSRLRVNTSFEHAVSSVAEVQRRYHDLKAYILFMREVRPLMGSDSVDLRTPTRHVMGTFTTSETLLQECWKAGIPVWYIRPYDTILDVCIKDVVTFEAGSSWLELSPMVENGPYIYHGPSAHPSKFKTIYSIAQHTYSYAAQALLRPPNTSVETSRPAKRQKTEPTNKNVQFEKAFFKPVNDPTYPTMVPVWATALDRVRFNAPLQPEFQTIDMGYVYPNPRLFLPQDDKKDKNQQEDPASKLRRLATMFNAWLRYREIFLLRNALSSDVERLRPKDWRSLFWTFQPTSSEGTHSADSQKKLKKMMNKFAEEYGITIQSSSAPLSWNEVSIPLDTPPPDHIRREIVWEVIELNFRWDLQAMEAVAALKPSKMSQQEWQDSERLLRIFRLHGCFPSDKDNEPGGDLTTVNVHQANKGLSSPDLEERRPFIINLAKIMSRWAYAPRELLGSLSSDMPASQLKVVEQACADHFCQSYFNRFRRAPVVPHFLPPPS